MSKILRAIFPLCTLAWGFDAAYAAAPAICNAPKLDDVDFFIEKVDFYPGLVLPDRRSPIYVRVSIGALKTASFRADWDRDPARFLLFAKETKQQITFVADEDALGNTKFLNLPDSVPADTELELFVIVPEKNPTTQQFVDACAKGNFKALPGATGTTAVVPHYSRLGAMLEPSWVPKQALLNGETRDVGHLDFRLLAPNVKSFGWARMFVDLKETLSSISKDVSTKMDNRIGLTGRLPGGWFVPWVAGTRILNDQPFDNVSSITSAGVGGLIPWKWSRSVFWNGLVRAPFSPEWSFEGQYERRIEQDLASRARFKDPNAVRLAGQFLWTPIHILTGPSYNKDDLSLEFAGHGWFLPSQRDMSNRKFNRLEGYMEVSLLVPVRKFAGVAGLSSAGTDAAKQRVRIKYSYGANEAKGFRPVNQVSLGYEVIK